MAPVLFTGATAVFSDIDPDTLCMDPVSVQERSPRTKAILPVHLFGHMADMNALTEIADANGLAVVADAAQQQNVPLRCGPVETPLHLRSAFQRSDDVAYCAHRIQSHTSHRSGACPVAEQRCAHEELWALSALDMDGIEVKKNSIMKLPYVTGRAYPLDAAQILEGLNDTDCFVFLETSRVAGEENTS